MKRSIFSLILAGILTVFSSLGSRAQIAILSGLDGGTYHSLAMDIAKNTPTDVEVLTTNGSVDNFNQLTAENGINLAFMQYDVLVMNKLLNSKLPDEIQIYYPFFLDEEVHLITRKDTKIKKIKQLKGKKVGIGTPEQGTHVTALTIKEKTGIDWDDVEIGSNEAYEALMKGEIDAYFYVGGTPIESLKKLGDTANIRLVKIRHKNLRDIYTSKKIEKGTYPWQKKTVTTIAVPTLIVINIKNMSLDYEKQVNQLLKEIKENMTKIQANGHPKWQDVYYQNQSIDWPYYYIRNKVE